MKSLQEPQRQNLESLKIAGHMGCPERGTATDSIEVPHLFLQASGSFRINA